MYAMCGAVVGYLIDIIPYIGWLGKGNRIPENKYMGLTGSGGIV